MDHNTIRTNRANLVVPDSKARTKIARDRNASGNGASAKNKAVAANKAVINKEATSKANDKSGFIRVFGRRGQLPPFACPCADRLQLQTTLQPRRSWRAILFYEIEHKG